MRSLSELIDQDDAAWLLVQEWIADASLGVKILLAERVAGEAALYAAQITTRSPMGAIALHAAGILIDNGWLRVLGSGGHSRFERSLPGWNDGRSNGSYLFADDVLGGMFALNGGALGEDESMDMDPAGAGQNLFYGIGVRKSYRKAFPLLLQAAQTGHIHCMNVVGYCYDLGLGVRKDISSAVAWYERAADGGHQIAVCNLAIAYDLGKEVNGCESLRQ